MGTANAPGRVPVTSERLRAMLRNPVYIGLDRYLGAERHAPELRLVDDETFASVQRQLAIKGGRPRHGNLGDRTHLLNGLISCARCGGRVDGQFAGTGRAYYRDRERAARRGCDLLSIRGRDLDGCVAAAVRDVGVRLGRGIDLRIREAVDASHEQATARARLEALTGELSRLNHIYRMGNIQAAEYAHDAQVLRRQMLDAREALDWPLERRLVAAAGVFTSLPDPLPYGDTPALKRLNSGLRMVIRRVVVGGPSPAELEWSSSAMLLHSLVGGLPPARTDALVELHFAPPRRPARAGRPGAPAPFLPPEPGAGGGRGRVAAG